MGGFECSTHRRRDGRRLDIIASTEHDRYVASDYRTLRELGIRTVRDGVRWHLVESKPHNYDFSSVLGMLRAARRTGTQVIWDLLHYGWPDDIDVFSPDFVARFAKFARAFARLFKNESDDIFFYCPVNEISFVAWGGGDAGFLNPFARGRDAEIKCQLVRACIEAIEAVRAVLPTSRIVHCEPAINIVGRINDPDDDAAAERYRLAQFQALDMIGGRLNPELGGKPDYLDIIGVNYYSNNQWVNHAETLYPFHPRYRPFAKILEEFYERYDRPIVLAETGIEKDLRPAWLAYICSEVRQAIEANVPVQGICLYPIVNHLGWDNDRYCPNGLLDFVPDANGKRAIYEPLARELRAQQELLEDFAPLARAGGQ